MGKKAEKKAETKAENEKNAAIIKNQEEERLYSFILEMQCPNCRKYFGLDVRRAKTIKPEEFEESIKIKIKDPANTPKLIVQSEPTRQAYSFLLVMDCPHCLTELGLDVSNAQTVTNY